MIQLRFTVALFIVDAIINQPISVQRRIDVDTRHNADTVYRSPGVATILLFRQGYLFGIPFVLPSEIRATL